MPQPILYHDYSRQEVQEIFDQEAKFTPGAGTWGLHGIVRLPRRRHDSVFFVTFGQRQADHEFDEGITSDGVSDGNPNLGLETQFENWLNS